MSHCTSYPAAWRPNCRSRSAFLFISPGTFTIMTAFGLRYVRIAAPHGRAHCVGHGSVFLHFLCESLSNLGIAGSWPEGQAALSSIHGVASGTSRAVCEYHWAIL